MKKNIIINQSIKQTYNNLAVRKVNTICVEGNCPNIGECFSKGKVTFLILGDKCTRNCLYCNVKKEEIGELLNYQEIENIKKVVSLNNLNHVVITSVTRDDLEDGGSLYYKQLCNELKSYSNDLTIEILTPDFGYKKSSIENIINSKADILSHNIELPESVYSKFRKDGSYENSLKLLYDYSNSGKESKSAFILGFGETYDDIKKTINDIAQQGVDYLSIGQYLAPSKKHMKPLKYYTHEEFETLSNWTKENFNFKKIDISFYSRSSYLD
jgi:lipoic acid synthetase